MTIESSSRKDMLEAMAQFDSTLRGTREWVNWENKKNHKYAIDLGGVLYPVKKIVSVASGTPVREFGGGNEANAYARKREFKITHLRAKNPDWCRDELIVALDFYLRNRDQGFRQGSPEIEGLSLLLQSIGRHVHNYESATFRNANGVFRRIGNFQSLDPNYPGKGLENIGALGKEVWEEFGHDPFKCEQIANLIIQSLEELEDIVFPSDDDDGSYEAEEGRIVARLHRRRERDKKIVEKKKNSELKRSGRLSCEACGITFEQVYGERGRDFIECHHTKPLHAMKPGEKTKLVDLVLLCANCHRMVHRKNPWPSIGELQDVEGVKKLRKHFKNVLG